MTSLYISVLTLLSLGGFLRLKLSFVLNEFSSLAISISISLVSFIDFSFLITFLINFLRFNSDYIAVLEILYRSNRGDIEISYIGVMCSGLHVTLAHVIYLGSWVV